MKYLAVMCVGFSISLAGVARACDCTLPCYAGDPVFMQPDQRMPQVLRTRTEDDGTPVPVIRNAKTLGDLAQPPASK